MSSLTEMKSAEGCAHFRVSFTIGTLKALTSFDSNCIYLSSNNTGD